MKQFRIIILILALCGIFSIASSQDFLWAKQMGGNSSDIAYSITSDAMGNVYATGRFNGIVDFDPGIGVYNLSSNGLDDIFVCKLDHNGNLSWAIQIGGADEDYGLYIARDNLENIYVTGYFKLTADFDPSAGNFSMTSAGYNDIFISKFDSSGNFIWAKQMGGPGSDSGMSITTDAFGNVYTTGCFNGTVDFDPGPGIFNLTSASLNDIYVSKLGSAGSLIWVRQIGGNSYDNVVTIALDFSQNIYITGNFWGTCDFNPDTTSHYLTSSGHFDIYILKLDSSGSFVWVKQMGGSQADDGYSVVIDIAGNIYLTGIFRDTADIDPGPNTFNLISSGNYDFFISKLDSLGNLLWAKSFGSYGDDIAYCIKMDLPGNIYITGGFTGVIDFDLGAGVYNLISTGGVNDIFTAKFDTSGSLLWAKGIGGVTWDFACSVAIDSSNNVYTAGCFTSTVDFDPNGGTYNLTAVGGYDIFIQKLGQSSTGIIENNSNDKLKVFPNPTTGNFIISYQHRIINGNIEILNALGQNVYEENILNQSKKEINIGNFAEGIYFVKVFDGERSYCKKFVVKKD